MANSREGRRIRRWLLTLALSAVALSANYVYRFRFRYSELNFRFYWDWATQLRAGVAPWRPQADIVYTPAFVEALVPLTWLKPAHAWLVWQFLQLAAFFAAVLLLARELGPLASRRATAALGVVVLLLPYLLAGTIYVGSGVPLLLLLVTLAWRLARRKRSGWAGLMLAGATVLKVYPACAAGYFLFRRRYRVVLWSALWTLVLVALTNPRYWLAGLWGASRALGQRDMYAQERALSIAMNLYAVTSERHFYLAALAAAAACLIASAAYATLKAPTGAEADGIVLGLWLAVSLLLAPVAWPHEIALLMPLYLYAADILLQRYRMVPVAARSLLLAGAVGIVVPYYSSPARSLHLYFFALVAQYLGGCWLVAGPGWRAEPASTGQRPVVPWGEAAGVGASRPPRSGGPSNSEAGR